MAQTVSVIIGAEDRARLTAVIGDRNRPQKHIQRARIVSLSVERLPVLTVASQVGVGRPSVWRWQQRFAENRLPLPPEHRRQNRPHHLQHVDQTGHSGISALSLTRILLVGYINRDTEERPILGGLVRCFLKDAGNFMLGNEVSYGSSEPKNRD
jgi:Homeodomain-like domain-containing protein